MDLRLSLSVMTTAAAVGLFTVQVVAQQDKPNLIFILTDDQGVESIQGPYWSNEMGCVTPTLDRLASQGVSFTQCRTNPNCSPTRASLMTGRYAIDTGVNGVLARSMDPDHDPCPDYTPLTYPFDLETNRLSLQTQERTLGEMLHDKGYYTILVDKWHVGQNQGDEDLGLAPTQQGFDEFYDWYETICDDNPDEIGDEHLLSAYQFAMQAVSRRRDKPYALFFHTITPHGRSPDHLGLNWWAVDPALTPLTAYLNADPTNTNRFIQNVEALDTVLRMMLVDLGVIQDIAQQWPYNPSSDTVVFFTSDNGTGPGVTSYRNGGDPEGKNTLFEGGIHVPLFVFGEDVPSNVNDPIEDPRQISDVDFYDTIADIVDASNQQRDNDAGNFPRRSMSFADSIGWAAPNSLPRRQWTLCSLGNLGVNQRQVWNVALIWDHYKLICDADSHDSRGQGLDDMAADSLYDLNDPNIADPQNLLELPLNIETANAYWYMRDRLVDQWPSAVSATFKTAQLPEYVVEFYSSDERYVYIMHVQNGQRCFDGCDEFYDLEDDPGRQNNLVGDHLHGHERDVYDSLRDEASDAFQNGTASPDIRIIDIPASDLKDVDDDHHSVSGDLTIGFEGAGGWWGEKEYRAGLKFDLTRGSLPQGFSVNDVVDAQIIVTFDHDSTQWQDHDYFDDDQDTGVISVYRMLSSWNDNRHFFDSRDIGDDVLGMFDPPPHIIPDPDTPIRGLPMPSGNPISFGHNQELLDVVRDWYNHPGSNNGVVLRAEKLESLDGDQQVNFKRQARLRLTLDRRH